MSKLITFTVPCYNSAAYMRRCIESLLPAGHDIEIIIVDDGSSDETGAIADAYRQIHPDVVRVVHQPNGGHGEGVNTGIKHATGLFFKVVDSDDWLDGPSLKKLMQLLRSFAAAGVLPDVVISNYVYEHLAEGKQKRINYKLILPEGRMFTWDEVGRFSPWQYLLMHSLLYRTDVLRQSGLVLPKHTFYVDNLYAYVPLVYTKNLYYLNVNLYRYFIGRTDQSVNESVMVRNLDHQLRMNRQLMRSHRLPGDIHPKALVNYLYHYLSIMMTISSLFCILSGEGGEAKKEALWNDLRDFDEGMYQKMRESFLGLGVNLPGKLGQKLPVASYRLLRKIFPYN